MTNQTSSACKVKCNQATLNPKRKRNPMSCPRSQYSSLNSGMYSDYSQSKQSNYPRSGLSNDLSTSLVFCHSSKPHMCIRQDRTRILTSFAMCNFHERPPQKLSSRSCFQVQYRSKVVTRDTRLDNFKSSVSSRVSNELVARLFLRRANPTNDLPLLCAVATFLLKRSTASRIESDIRISVFRTLQKY